MLRQLHGSTRHILLTHLEEEQVRGMHSALEWEHRQENRIWRIEPIDNEREQDQDALRNDT